MKVKYELDGHTLFLPGKRVVCTRCDGEGTHLNPSIGEYAYSREEFEEAFPEPEDQEEYFKRGGIYDVVCEVCHGRNVNDVVDWDHLEERAKHRKLLAKLLDRIRASEEAELEYRRMVEMERRYGC